MTSYAIINAESDAFMGVMEGDSPENVLSTMDRLFSGVSFEFANRFSSKDVANRIAVRKGYFVFKVGNEDWKKFDEHNKETPRIVRESGEDLGYFEVVYD